MYWSEVIEEQISALKQKEINLNFLKKLYSLIDLTSLNEGDEEQDILKLCEKAESPLGHVASICTYPHFVRLTADRFANTPVNVGTVANFPEGHASIDVVLSEISKAILDGAQEIDVVFPYNRYLAGEIQHANHFIATCKEACGDTVVLKVILETGVLKDPAIIADATFSAITAGADFIKTSTGKISEGATLEAVSTILLVLKHTRLQLNRYVGCKVSGGIRHIETASQFVALAEQIMGNEWVFPTTFRIGASKLVDEILSNMAITHI